MKWFENVIWSRHSKWIIFILFWPHLSLMLCCRGSWPPGLETSRQSNSLSQWPEEVHECLFCACTTEHLCGVVRIHLECNFSAVLYSCWQVNSSKFFVVVLASLLSCRCVIWVSHKYILLAGMKTASVVMFWFHVWCLQYGLQCDPDGSLIRIARRALRTVL